MNTVTAGRKVVVLALVALMIAVAVFAGALANTATVSAAHEKQKTPTVAQKQMLDDVMCCQS